jgi:membrane protease YdiL (CAAX protease family)
VHGPGRPAAGPVVAAIILSPMLLPRFGFLPEPLTGRLAALRAVGLAALALGLEWGRVLAAREPALVLASLVLGGCLLSALGLGFRARELGLSRSHLGLRLVGGVAVAAVLLLPALAREHPGPLLPAPFAAAAIAVSVGEEIAFRGALFAAIDAWLGPAPAILGSSLVFTAAHALSHPPEFLLAVAAAGVLLSTWRWACDDLVAPIVAHCIADLAL